MEFGKVVYCADDCPIDADLTSCKQLAVSEVDRKLCLALNRRWHSRMPEIGFDSIGDESEGHCGKASYFGAEFNKKIYGVAIWSLPIAANRLTEGFSCYELRRMAISSFAPKFTPSRMLSLMVKWIKKNRPNVVKLISYQDTGVHKGTIYAASGWTPCKASKFISWTQHTQIKAREGQSTAPKIRWELDLRKPIKA